MAASGDLEHFSQDPTVQYDPVDGGIFAELMAGEGNANV